MKYNRMGKTGMRVSSVSLGAWLTFGGTVEEQMAIDTIHKAIELDVNFIDVADVYARGNAELVVGKALAGDTYARKDLIISSKVFWPMSDKVNDSGLSRKHIFDSIDNSLKRLDQDYLDIYFAHRFDWKADIYETVSAMDDLVRDGRVRYWGTSVWSAAQLERAVGVAKEIGAYAPMVEQPRYNMLDRHIELEVMKTTKYHGMGIVPWSPLAQGILTGKYNDGIPSGSRGETSEFMKSSLTEENFVKTRKLTELAKKNDMTMANMALAWVLRRDEITSVITGATKIGHIEENVKASEIVLSNGLISEIDTILDNEPKWHPVYSPSLPDRS